MNIGFRLLNFKIYIHDAFHWLMQIIISAAINNGTAFTVSSAWCSRSLSFNGGMFFTTFVLLTQYCAGDKIEKIEMGWACGAYG